MPEYKLPALDDVLCAAIVDRFFEPVVTGVNYIPGASINGYQQMTAVPTHGEAPLAAVARQMYQDHTKSLAAQIWERLDVDALATKIAEHMLERLFSGRPTNWNGYGGEATEVTALKAEVNKRLADELTRRQLAKLDSDEAHGR